MIKKNGGKSMDSNFLVNKKKLIKIIIVVAGELCCSGGAMEEVAICVLLDVRSEFMSQFQRWMCVWSINNLAALKLQFSSLYGA